MQPGTVWAPDTWDADAWADNTWADAAEATTRPPVAGGLNLLDLLRLHARPRPAPLDFAHNGRGGFEYTGAARVVFEPAAVSAWAFEGAGGFAVAESGATMRFDNQIRTEARRAARRAQEVAQLLRR